MAASLKVLRQSILCRKSVFTGLNTQYNGSVCRMLRTSRDRMPHLKEMYKRRLKAGPEPCRHPSVYGCWNYDSELYAFGKRVGEEFDQQILETACIARSFVDAEIQKRKELGVETTALMLEDNAELSSEGREFVSDAVKAYLRYRYPHMFEEAICAVTDFLLSTEILAHVGQHIGLRELIKSETYPPDEEEISNAFLATVGALTRSQGKERAVLFVLDFVIPQLIDKDINEIWKIDNPMGVLKSVLESMGESPPESRIIGQSGSSTVMSLFHVGIYSDRKLIGKSPGETLQIAEEMAARDALKTHMRSNTTQHLFTLGSKVPVDQLLYNRENTRVEQLMSKHTQQIQS